MISKRSRPGLLTPLLNQINKAFQLEGALLDHFHALRKQAHECSSTVCPIPNYQLTNLRSCTLSAKPIAMNVANTEERPALIKGSGTPITGKRPRAMPTLMKI